MNKRVKLPEPRSEMPSQELTDTGIGSGVFIALLMFAVAFIKVVTA